MKVLVFIILIVLLILYAAICVNAIKDLVVYFKSKKENVKKGD